LHEEAIEFESEPKSPELQLGRVRPRSISEIESNYDESGIPQISESSNGFAIFRSEHQ